MCRILLWQSSRAASFGLQPTLTRIKRFWPSCLSRFSTSSTHPNWLPISAAIVGETMSKGAPQIWIHIATESNLTFPTLIPCLYHEHLIIKRPWATFKNPLHLKFRFELELEQVWADLYHLHSLIQSPRSSQRVLCHSFIEWFACEKFPNEAQSATLNFLLPTFIRNSYYFLFFLLSVSCSPSCW